MNEYVYLIKHFIHANKYSFHAKANKEIRIYIYITLPGNEARICTSSKNTNN